MATPAGGPRTREADETGYAGGAATVRAVPVKAEFKVQGSRFKVQGSKFKVQSSRFKVQGSRFEALL
jgi:hypothetical protein